MSLLEKRLQLLLDVGRYERIAAEADRSGRSVAAVIREAIDFRFPDDGDTGRIQAARDLLDLTATAGPEPGEGPADLKAAYDARLDAKLAAR
ncbi:MAG: antitoxin [Actinomycetia bacterium]|nr:antitoxin [Actinomycetes bacterium]